MIGDKRQQRGFTLVEILTVVGIFSILILVIINIFILALRAQRQTALRQEALADLRFVTESIAQQVRVSEVYYPTPTSATPNPPEYGGSINGPEQEIHLLSQNGTRYSYYAETVINSAGVAVGQIRQVITEPGGSPLSSLVTNPDEINVVTLNFYIDPPGDPFYAERCNGSHAPTGCLTVQNSCTVNDVSSDFKSGFCTCSDDSECATRNCDTAEGICLPFDVQPRVTMVVSFQSLGTRPEDLERVSLQTTVSSRVYKR